MISFIRFHKLGKGIVQITTQARSYRGELQTYITAIAYNNDKEKYGLLADFLVEVEQCRNKKIYDDCSTIPIKSNIDISLTPTKWDDEKVWDINQEKVYSRREYDENQN